MSIRNIVIAIIINITSSLFGQVQKLPDQSIIIRPDYKDEIDTNKIFSISKSRLKGLPTYYPNTEKAPLSMEEAKNIAIKYVNKNIDNSDDLGVYEIRLQHFGFGDSELVRLSYKMWVYLVYFLYDHGINMEVVPVLLDGTVVKPGSK